MPVLGLRLLYTHLARHPRLRLQGPLRVGTPSFPPPISSRPNYPGSVPAPPGCATGPSDSNTPQIGPSPPPPTACLHFGSRSTFHLHRPVRSRFLAPGRGEGTGVETGRPGPRDGSAGLRCTARGGRRMGQRLPPLTPRPPGAGAVNVVDQIDSHHAWKSAVSC